MITFKSGDIFKEEAEALVNTVNCEGVMGRGLALQFKKRFPDNFKQYEAACKSNKVLIGKMYVHYTGNLSELPKYIINFPTKKYWRQNSRIEYITEGLKDLVQVIQELHITEIAIPPLGTGLGKLNWHEVKNYINTALEEMDDVNITVFEPTEPNYRCRKHGIRFLKTSSANTH